MNPPRGLTKSKLPPRIPFEGTALQTLHDSAIEDPEPLSKILESRPHGQVIFIMVACYINEFNATRVRSAFGDA
jgi:hypothetical protein